MPGTTSTALRSFSHDQHHETDAAKWKGDRHQVINGCRWANCSLRYLVTLVDIHGQKQKMGREGSIFTVFLLMSFTDDSLFFSRWLMVRQSSLKAAKGDTESITEAALFTGSHSGLFWSITNSVKALKEYYCIIFRNDIGQTYPFTRWPWQTCIHVPHTAA